MIKIRVSYERPEELRRILEKLQPDVTSWKVSRNREGQHLKAYIIINSCDVANAGGRKWQILEYE